MSIESAKLFIEKMKADEEFCKKVTACADTSSRMAFVKAAGFDFTAADIDGIRREMSDSELEKVAGGKGHYACCGFEPYNFHY